MRRPSPVLVALAALIFTLLSVPVAPVAAATSSIVRPATSEGAAVSSFILHPSSLAQPRYVFPVQPGRGAWYQACHHDYPATDIFIPAGSRFVAVTAGVVDYVSYADAWDPATDEGDARGGLSVAIVGDDGVRYYGSHLSRIAPGIKPRVRVRVGQLLGYTGKTGSASGTPPHLHFGISRPTTPDDWAARRGQISPYPYLNLWRKGINRTPDLSKPNGGAC
jgi:murein DD-endopeptidase MepM/ murein hydrolase activator NlpD